MSEISDLCINHILARNRDPVHIEFVIEFLSLGVVLDLFKWAES